MWKLRYGQISKGKDSTQEGVDRVVTSKSTVPSRSVVKGFVLIFFLTMLILCWLVWYTWRSNRHLRSLETRHFRIVALSGQIIHIDEVLTMSARMAASTGDLQWESRYRSFEPQLDAAIKEVRELSPEKFISDAIDQTDVANLELVAMENKAFDLIRMGDRPAAAKLLDSQKYENQKGIYSNGIKEVVDAIHSRENARLKSEQRVALTMIVLLIAAVPLVGFIWLVALRILRRYISERKRAEETLRLRNRAITDATNGVIIASHGPDDNLVIYVNPAFERITGYSFEEVIGRDCRFLQGEDCAQPALAEVRLALKQGRDCHVIVKNYRKDGSLFWNELSVSPVRDEQGRLTHFIGIISDVTKRKRAEELLLESEKLFRDFFESSVTGFHIFAPNRIIADMNEAELNMIGYSRDEIVDKKTWADLIVPEERSLFDKHWNDIVTKGHIRNVEYTLVHKNGHHIHVILNASSRFDENGNLVNTRGSVLNITKRKTAEEQLAKSEEKYRNFFETAMVGLYRTRIEDGKVLAANQAFAEMLGYESPQDIVGKFVMAEHYVNPERRQELLRVLKEKGKVDGFDILGTRRDGSFLAIAISAAIYPELGYIEGAVTDITERKRAEEEIARLAKLPGENPNPVLRFSGDGELLYSNKASAPLLDLWGLRAGGILSGKWHEYVRESLVTGQTSQAEVQCGDLIFVLTFAPIVDSQYVNIYASDVTERKKAEEELRESEQKYRLLFDSNPHPMWVHDIETLKFMAVNDTAISCYGYSRKEFLRMTIKDIRPVEDVPALLESISDIKPGIEFGGVWRHTKKDGTVFYVETIAHTITFDDRPAEIVLATDVTERKLAEDALERERNLLRTILDTMPDYVYVKDVESRFVAANVAVAHLMGAKSADELIGKTDHDFYPKEMADEFRADEQQIVQTGQALVNKDEPGISPEGKMIWALTTKVPLRDKTGEIVGVVGVSRNITARKQAEHARDILVKELDAKNKELESIIYAASHDLRSPLVNIQGFSHELSRYCNQIHSALDDMGMAEKMSEEVRIIWNKEVPAALGFILTSATKMDSLLSGLLRLSRLGRAAMKTETLDMNAMVASIIRSMEYQIKDAGTTVEVGSLPTCVGDASQINQVFSNLLDNALKYLDSSRPGVIRIDGRIERDRSLYCVQDNGVGIAPNHQGKVFEIFHRLNPEDKRGEGLGLTIVRRVLDRHNGKIFVESELGKGSKFFVVLPTA